MVQKGTKVTLSFKKAFSTTVTITENNSSGRVQILNFSVSTNNSLFSLQIVTNADNTLSKILIIKLDLFEIVYVAIRIVRNYPNQAQAKDLYTATSDSSYQSG